MIKYINTFFVTVKGTLRKPLVYIIIVQLLLGLFSYGGFAYIYKNKCDELALERAKNEVLEDRLVKKNDFIIDFLTTLNAKTTMALEKETAKEKQ